MWSVPVCFVVCVVCELWVSCVSGCGDVKITQTVALCPSPWWPSPRRSTVSNAFGIKSGWKDSILCKNLANRMVNIQYTPRKSRPYWQFVASSKFDSQNRFGNHPSLYMCCSRRNDVCLPGMKPWTSSLKLTIWFDIIECQIVFRFVIPLQKVHMSWTILANLDWQLFW